MMFLLVCFSLTADGSFKAIISENQRCVIPPTGSFQNGVFVIAFNTAFLFPFCSRICFPNHIIIQALPGP